MKSFHRFISYLFFPGSMALFGFWLIQLTRPAEWPGTPWIWPLLFSAYFLFPLGVLYLLIALKVLPDIHLYERKLRNISYPVAIAGALAAMLWLQYNAVSPMVASWSRAILAVLSCIWVINASWLKASTHAAGTAGFLALCLELTLNGASWFILPAALLIAGLVYASRLALSAHSHKELIVGFALGFIATFALV